MTLTPEQRERRRESDRKWRAANPEYYRQRYAANREKAQEYARNWRAAHPEKSRENSRKYREANPEKVKGRILRWRADHPDRVKAHKHKLHDKERFNGYRQSVLNANQGVCVNCGGKAILVHHIDGRGRDHPAPNHDPKNLVPMCNSCHAKHHKAIQDAHS